MKKPILLILAGLILMITSIWVGGYYLRVYAHPHWANAPIGLTTLFLIVIASVMMLAGTIRYVELL